MWTDPFRSAMAFSQVWAANACWPAQLAALARWRLGALLAHGMRASPWLARRLRGVDPWRTPLHELPPMCRDDAMANFDDWLTDRRVRRTAVEAFVHDPGRVGEPFGAGHAVWTSSGTRGGSPGLFVHDPDALAIYDALELVRCSWPPWPPRPPGSPWHGPGTVPAAIGTDEPAHAGASPDADRGPGHDDLPPGRRRWRWPRPGDRYAVVCMTGGHYATLATVERMRRLQPWLRNAVQVFDGMQPTDRLAAQLQAYGPQWLATYPSTADLLADAQRAGRMSLRLRGVWTGGETLSPAARMRLAATFDCPVRDDYGASECLPIASQCAAGSLHVNEDWVLLEPVDAQMRAVPPGETSATVLLTNLANHLQPLVRYDLGDRVTRLASACACGSPFAAIRVEGREDEIVELADRAGRRVRLSPLALVGVLEDDARVHAFQLVRLDMSRLELRLGPPCPADGDAESRMARARQALGIFLAKHGLHDIRIDAGTCAPACHPRSGKLRRVLAQAPAATASTATPFHDEPTR